ncbi:MAG: FkbM family methyltransferase [Acidobacteria bacterium]|nr:FkbM family methyltransferase [Acidobacteriota bacterium]
MSEALKGTRAELKSALGRGRRADRIIKRLEERHEADKNRLTISRERLAGKQAEKLRLRRLLFSSHVLADLAGYRRATFPPPSLKAEGERRELAFRASSPAYDAAIGAPWPRPGVAEISNGGLRLWVPLDARQPDRLERAARQDIPYHAILQSREVAIGGVMLDIGANVGRTSLPRVLLGDVRAVYGAEADADNFECLVHAVIDNGLRGFVLPDHVAIGPRDATATLRRSKYVGGHRIHAGASKENLELVEVPLRRLDTWMTQHGIDAEAVSFVKVDVQGWESGVVQGAEGLLAFRRAAWQLEVDPHLLAFAESSLPELISLVTPHFTHFVDLSTHASGDRHRPVAELAEALAYLPSDGSLGTDVLLYSLHR